MNTISICGAGWLGLPLGKQLLSTGNKVNVSTTRLEKHNELQNDGFNSYLFSISPDNNDKLPESFFDTDSLVITVPFKRSLTDPQDYLHQIKHILNHTPADTYIIFTSSTSVYTNTNDWVTEDSPIEHPTRRQMALLEVEKLILDRRGTVLRLAGLYGPDRHIGGFLRHTTTPKPGQTPVNLVHRDDVLAILSHLLKKPAPGTTLNVVSDAHPSRKELYTTHARRRGFPIPEFDDSNDASFKLVSNQRLKDMLGYSFKHSDPMSH